MTNRERLREESDEPLAEEPSDSEEPTSPEEEEKDKPFILMLFSMTVYTLLTMIFIGIAAGAVGSALGYYRLDTVLSGSMRPTYPEGSIILAFSKPKENISTGDVIIFRSPEKYGGETVTHRVISARLTETGDVYVRTKGDNNSSADPWEARVTASEVWEVRNGLPYVGYLAHYAKTWWPLLIALAVSIPMLSFANGQVKEVYSWGRKETGRRKKVAP